MHVLITGATGFVGRRLTAHFIADGVSVSCLSRNPDKARGRLPGLLAAHAWTPGEPLDTACLVGVDAVVHLAGEPVSGRWSDEKQRRVRASRVDGTRTIVNAILEAESPPEVLVSASGIGFYGDGGEELLPETAAPGDDFFARLCVDWELEALRARDAGLRVAVARVGMVLGPNGGPVAVMRKVFGLGVGGPIGGGTQWWSWIDIHDAVRGLALMVKDDRFTGPVNLVAPEPIRQRNFALALGVALSRPAVLPAPTLAVSLILGEFSAEVLASKRVSPERLTQAGFEFERSNVLDSLSVATGSSRKVNLLAPILAAAILGLAPFVPEPHLLGKLRWIAGGGLGMGPLDALDLFFHGVPWVWLLGAMVLRLGAARTRKLFGRSTEA